MMKQRKGFFRKTVTFGLTAATAGTLLARPMQSRAQDAPKPKPPTNLRVQENKTPKNFFQQKNFHTNTNNPTKRWETNNPPKKPKPPTNLRIVKQN